MRKDIKASCQKRLGRIEGQVRGLSKMVDEDRYCIDIVTQISAVRAALRRVEEEVLRDHVSHCVEHAITSGNKADHSVDYKQIIKVFEALRYAANSKHEAYYKRIWEIANERHFGHADELTKYVITNSDRNNVVVRAYWMFVVAHGAGKPMSIEIMGSSEDYLRRSGGAWLIRERRVAP